MNKFYCKICHKEIRDKTRFDKYMHIEKMHIDRIVQDGIRTYIAEVPEVASIDIFESPNSR